MNSLPTIEELHSFSKNTLSNHLGIEFVEISKSKVVAKMPVNQHTMQPYGKLHGGASAALAETLASVGGALNINRETHNVVGLSLTINHIKSVGNGWVTAEAIPIHLGKNTQVWEIKIMNEDQNLVSDARLTLAVIKTK